MISTVEYNINYDKIINETKNLTYTVKQHTINQDCFVLYRNGFKCDLPEGYTKETVLNTVKNYDVNQCCIRILKPMMGYTIDTDKYRWHHTDTYHIVLQTQPGNYFCYPERMDGPQMIELTDQTVLYKICAKPLHTFINMSEKPRIHMTFESLII